MAFRKIQELTNAARTKRATISLNTDHREYRVRLAELYALGYGPFWVDQNAADYFTNDRQDAQDTALLMIGALSLTPNGPPVKSMAEIDRPKVTDPTYPVDLTEKEIDYLKAVVSIQHPGTDKTRSISLGILAKLENV